MNTLFRIAIIVASIAALYYLVVQLGVGVAAG